MAAPSISTYILSNSSHYYGSEGGAAVMTSPSDSVTKVSAIISQTSGGAAIETVDTTVKTSSDLYADRWALTWPTAGITSSPYYVRMWATNADGDGAVREVAPYIYFPPSVSVTSPANGSTLTDSSVTMAWTATDDYGISYQRASVSHDGTELWGAEVEGNSIAVPSSVVFEDGESYSFSVTARNGKGMESTATSTVSFSFVAPSVPELVIAEGDGKSASITVTDSSYTDSGTVLEASSSMMESLTIQGLSVQDGTPTPSAPVAIKSVQSTNLIDSTNIINAYYTAAGGIVANSGNRVIWMPCCPNTLYSVAKTMREDGKDRFYIAYTTEQPANGVAVYGVKNIQGSDSTEFAGKRIQRSITTGADARFLVIWAGQATFDDSYSKTQVCNGFAFYPYREYGEIAVRSCGKNLSDTPMLGVYDQSAKYFAENNKTYATSTLFRADGAEQFTVSTDFTFGQALIYCWEDDGSYLGFNSSGSAGRKSATLTTLDGTALAAITIRNTDTSQDIDLDDLTSYQVEKGSTATAYEPYSSTTTPIPVTLRSLPDGTHDELTIDADGNATMVQRVRSLDLANFSNVWKNTARGENSFYVATTGFGGAIVAGCALMSDWLVQVSDADSITNTELTMAWNSASTNFLFNLPFTVTTTSDALAWLQANHPILYYESTTPQTTSLGTITLPYVDGSAWVDAEVTPNIEATFRPVDFPDQPAADSVDVVRVNADGSTWTVASNLTMGDTVTDPLPPLGVEAVYKAVGRTSAGGMSEKLFMHEIPTTGWVLNFGDAAQETVGFIYNPQATMTLAQGGESYHFADGGMGGGFPVFYPTTDRDASGTLAFDTVLYGDSDRLLDLCRRYPVAWLRDPFGHRWRAHVRPSVSHGVGQVWPVTIAWDAVRFEEV